MNPPNLRLAYRQAAAQTATPIGLVIILYDQAADDLRRALAALEAGDIEQRTAQINHLLAVLEELHGRLDFEKGGDSAKQLDKFYSMVRGRALEAQIKQSRSMLEEILGFVADMRAAWKQVEDELANSAQPSPATQVAEAPQKEGSSAANQPFFQSVFEIVSSTAWSA